MLDQCAERSHSGRVATGLDVGAAGRRAFAATWRTKDDQVAATTWGGTMCWFPVKPGSLRIEREGFHHIVRCRDCPGCLELDRRRLADRLSTRYPRDGRDLYLVRIYAPGSTHAGFSHALHRRRALGLEPGFFRLGASSFAVLVRDKHLVAHALRKMALVSRIEKIRFRRGRRAWRSLTAGLLVSRDTYGAQVKRWYARGLPAAERESWTVTSKPYQRGYDRRSSPRAWTESKLVLVPPEVWRMGRRDRRTVREMLRRAPDPESARVVIDLVAALNRKFAQHLPLEAAPKGRLSKEQVREWYQKMAAKKAASETSGSGSEILPPLSEVGGYASSVHSSPTEQSKLVSDDELLKPGASGDPAWMERERQRVRLRGQREAAKQAKDKTWIEQWAEKMQSLVKGRDKGG